MMKQTKVKKKEEEIPGRSLIDLVLSWSINDVLNEDYYKYQVKKIPQTFSSTEEYMSSFRIPVIEETHADLLSSMSTLSQAPISKIYSVKKTKKYAPPKNFFYTVTLAGNGKYKPQVGDVIALADLRPSSTNDLDRPNRSYLVAYLHKTLRRVRENLPVTVSVLSSEPISNEEQKTKQSKVLYAVYLMNMTTNIRIWRSLNYELEGGNLNIIQKLLQPKSADVEDRTINLLEENCSTAFAAMRARILSSDLNDSQKSAVRSCLVSRELNNQNTVKLIWGPPGTGKTKTVGLLLFSLLKMKCRTLTCAPTNIAVLEVIQRLLKNVTELLEYDIYGLGDIVLFGNEERMNISDRHHLLDVFLDNRVDVLSKCFASSGWEGNIQSTIRLLKDPKKQYRLYLNSYEVKNHKVEKNSSLSHDEARSTNQGEKIDGQSSRDKKSKRNLKKVLIQALNENQNKKTLKEKVPSEKEKKLDHEEKGGEVGSSQDENTKLTFAEFLQRRFKCIVEPLKLCIQNLYTHLPTSLLSLEVAKNMIKALNALKSLEAFLCAASVADKRLEQVFSKSSGSSHGQLQESRTVKECLHTLESLDKKLLLPKFSTKEIKEFCLQNACLIFCTVSSSAKLYQEKMTRLEVLVIDEAAQLKECESTIPLQLPGLHHAILIGDERQLPAMVKSKASEEAEFGRSLFQRLVLLGHRRDLINVQHRMHPSISLFPNREFYDNKILDGQNVQERSYDRRFLQGKMYGSYSFINVAHGKEEFDHSHSMKNSVEVAVVYEIVASLFKVSKESIRTNKKVKVGIISPYKAQVSAIEKKVEKYRTGAHGSNFSVRVSSVDGFQGGEEDVIIISTVRCNGNGAVGFLSNRQRANVALTRARHCLWIVGNGATLYQSGSVWKELVIDAKKRGCFYDADEDKSLAQALVATVVENDQMDILLNKDSVLFRKARWKVFFSNFFLESMSRAKNAGSRKEVLTLLTKLANGWRQSQRKKNLFVHHGASFPLLEQYKVNGSQILVWTTDIVQENAHYIQILKVWDILPLSEMPKVANRLDILFRNYTVDMMNLCKHKCLDRSLVVPMRWPLDLTGCPGADPVKSLSEPLASLSLRDESETSSSTNTSISKSPMRSVVTSRRQRKLLNHD